MAINFSDFSRLANPTGQQDASLRLCAKDHRIMIGHTSQGFFAKLFGWIPTESEKKNLWRAFLEAARTEYGQGLADELLGRHLPKGGDTFPPLTTRIIATVCQEFQERGGQHWRGNQKRIERATQNPSPDETQTSFRALLDSALDSVAREHDGIPEALIADFKRHYTPAPETPVLTGKCLEFSNLLRQKLQKIAENRPGKPAEAAAYVALDDNAIKKAASATAKAVFTEAFQSFLATRFEEMLDGFRARDGIDFSQLVESGAEKIKAEAKLASCADQALDACLSRLTRPPQDGTPSPERLRLATDLKQALDNATDTSAIFRRKRAKTVVQHALDDVLLPLRAREYKTTLAGLEQRGMTDEDVRTLANELRHAAMEHATASGPWTPELETFMADYGPGRGNTLPSFRLIAGFKALETALNSAGNPTLEARLAAKTTLIAQWCRSCADRASSTLFEDMLDDLAATCQLRRQDFAEAIDRQRQRALAALNISGADIPNDFERRYALPDPGNPPSRQLREIAARMSSAGNRMANRARFPDAAEAHMTDGEYMLHLWNEEAEREIAGEINDRIYDRIAQQNPFSEAPGGKPDRQGTGTSGSAWVALEGRAKELILLDKTTLKTPEHLEKQRAILFKHVQDGATLLGELLAPRPKFPLSPLRKGKKETENRNTGNSWPGHLDLHFRAFLEETDIRGPAGRPLGGADFSTPPAGVTREQGMFVDMCFDLYEARTEAASKDNAKEK